MRRSVGAGGVNNVDGRIVACQSVFESLRLPEIAASREHRWMRLTPELRCRRMTRGRLSLTDKGHTVPGWRERHVMHPTSVRRRVFPTDSTKGQTFTPDGRLGSVGQLNILCGSMILSAGSVDKRQATHLGSTPFTYAENTYALLSAVPAARSTLFGCQSMESTVERSGFLMCFDTHQLFSSSK